MVNQSLHNRLLKLYLCNNECDLGINVRHLGMLWNSLTHPGWKKAVLTEAVIRVAR